MNIETAIFGDPSFEDERKMTHGHFVKYPRGIEAGAWEEIFAAWNMQPTPAACQSIFQRQLADRVDWHGDSEMPKRALIL